MMAVAFKAADPTPFAGQTKPTLAVNYYGTMQVTKALLPLLLDSNAADPRIVNVASMAGKLRQLQPARQREFASPSLTIDALDSLVAEFEADVAAGKDLSAAGWGRSNCE
jgi:NAD(P)-dependent dehydrogenase (short-subunit alcohol dehydrogenase family)